MEIKDIIKQKRLAKGLRMKDLADMVGVSEATISRWEAGFVNNMKRNKVASLCESLDLNPSLFLTNNPTSDNTLYKDNNPTTNSAMDIFLELLFPENEHKEMKKAIKSINIKGEMTLGDMLLTLDETRLAIIRDSMVASYNLAKATGQPRQEIKIKKE